LYLDEVNNLKTNNRIYFYGRHFMSSDSNEQEALDKNLTFLRIDLQQRLI